MKESLMERINKCFLEPKGSRVVVHEDEFHYKGSLCIPDNAKRRPTTGVILKIGPNVVNVQVGERVVFAQFSGTLIQFRSQPAYRILSEEEILSEVTVEDSDLEETYA